MDKLNKNGEGVPASELEAVKAQLLGAKVRYCPHGISIDGHHKDHMCGINQTTADIVGVVTGYSIVTGKEGKEVVKPQVRLIDGIKKEALPNGWSMLAEYGEKDASGFVHGIRDLRIDLTNEPAYEEARRTIYTASAVEQKPNESFSTLNTKTAILAGSDKSMANDDKGVTPTETPQAAPVDAKPTTPSEPAKAEVKTPAGKIFTQDEVDKLLAAVGSSVKEEAVKETKALIEKESAAKELVATAEKLGVIKAEEAEARFAQYMKMDKEVMASIATDFKALSAKMATPKEKTLAETPLQTPTDNKVPEGVKNVLKLFGYSDADAERAAKAAYGNNSK